MSFLLKWWRELLLLIFIPLTVYLGTKDPEVRIEERVVTKVEVQKVIEYKTKIEYRDKKTTVSREIQKPDGTKIVEKIDTNDRSRLGEKEERKTERAVTAIEKSVVTVKTSAPRILGIGYNPIADRFSLGLYYPLGNTPFNIGIAINYEQHAENKNRLTDKFNTWPRGISSEFGLIYRF